MSQLCYIRYLRYYYYEVAVGKNFTFAPLVLSAQKSTGHLFLIEYFDATHVFCCLVLLADTSFENAGRDACGAK